ncbi:MAG TPA: hypothetical protein VNU49_05470 [Opitutaceae bacterium]|nr:hypothetical protein [Opitutaceae bacterium]
MELAWNLLPDTLKASRTRLEIESCIWAVDGIDDYALVQRRFGSVMGIELKMDDGGKSSQLTIHLVNQSPLTVPVTLDRFLGATNQSLGIIGEVLYIGQTDDDEEHRLERHEKLQQVLALRRGDEQTIVLIGRFNVNRLTISSSTANNLNISEGAETEIADGDKLTLVEMALINYFKPELNEIYKKSDGLHGLIIDRSLVAAGFDAIEVHFDPDNPLMFAGSKAAGFKEEHHIKFSRQGN